MYKIFLIDESDSTLKYSAFISLFFDLSTIFNNAPHENLKLKTYETQEKAIMAISLPLLEYLEWEGVDYELLHHAYVGGSMKTSQIAHIPGDQLAKCVVLEDEKGYLMTVLPATHHVDIDKLKHHLGRDLQFATENEIKDLFDDCSIGAIPPAVKAFGYDAVIDDSLADCKEVYFEAGDHAELVHMKGEDFNALMADMPHYSFSQHI